MPERSERIHRLNEETDQYDLPYVSKSRVMQWQKNPEHFRLKYLEGIREPETFAMKRGTAIHESFEHYYEQVQREQRHIEPEEPSALPPDRAKWADFLEPHITNFFAWEYRRWHHALHDPESYVPVAIEEELWADDVLGIDGEPEWMGIADAVLPAYGVPDVEETEGVVVVDFKTGKVPREEYRDEIFMELEYYTVLFEQKYDVVASAAYYPKEDTTLVNKGGYRDEVLRAAEDMIRQSADYTGDTHFETKEGPLCKWGMDSDEQSAYYGVCANCTWGVPANNPETFKTMLEQGYPIPDVAEALGTSVDAVVYWARKMDIDTSREVQNTMDVETDDTGYWKYD